MIRRLLACGAVGLLVVTSCEPGPPKVYPVKGIIVNKGKGSVKDVVGYNVQLQSMTDPTEMPGGTVGEDGTFVLYTRWGGKVVEGAKAGTYKAWLEQAPLEGRKPPPPVIPVRYTNADTSGLEFTIEPRANEITIEIDRGAR
jgi:hypothetical protein